MTGSRFDDLLAQVSFPESWKPKEKGDHIVGEAVRWATVSVAGHSDEAKSCDVLTLRCPDGVERNVWTWHSVLRLELVGKVEPGSLVAIEYLGRREKQKGEGSYAGYRVAIQAASASGGSSAASPSQQDDIPF